MRVSQCVASSVCLLIALLLSASAVVSGEELDADVAVVGATVCGVAACVAAARMNASCALVEPSAHLGGMTSGGLSGVDLRMDLGGIAREIFGTAHFPNVEPHVLAARLSALLAGARPGALALRASAGALALVDCVGGPCTAGGGRPLARIAFAGGLAVTARYFLDCSYEGDLLRSSGTPWVLGRESAAEFNESLAGVSGGRAWGKQLAAYVNVSPWADAGKTSLLATVAPLPAAAPGDGDDLVMAMNYRLTLTDNASNSRPFAAPAGYAPADMELLRRWFATAAGRNASSLSQLFLLRQLPGAKMDVNQGAMPMGSDMPFLQHAYPLGNATARAAVAAAHEWWTRAAWHFLRTDAAVPAALRAEAARWALPLDEFEDTAGFPPQLYVRESIRMRGAAVLTQRDVVGAALGRSNASVGLSQWCVDVHAEQRVAVPPAQTGRSWEVADAGGVNTCSGDPMPWQLTEIPYGALTPARGDGTPNLLVPVCASMTHIAFATYRLEAQYAVHGQSAAVAAVLALRAGAAVAVQDVDVGALQAALRAQGQLIDAEPGPAAGALALAPCGGAAPPQPSQAWQVNASDGSLRAAGGEICASVFAYSKLPGAAIWGARCHTGDPSQPANQAWDAVEAPGGVRVRSRLSGLCVAADAKAGTNLSQLACDGAATLWSAPPDEPAAGPWAPAGAPSLCVTCLHA